MPPPPSQLPIDPIDTSSSRLYYTYDTNGSQYEITMVPESQKYQLGGSNDVISNDGGYLASVYEKGNVTGLEPLDYGDPTLVGYWLLNEGTGTVAYDDSGNNATGSWSGTQVGTNGYYYAPGKVGAYAGDFDGSTNYVAINSTNYPTSNNPVSVTAWINSTVVSGDDAIVGWGSGSTDGPTFMIANAHLYLNVNGGSYSPQSSFVIPANSWSFVGITYTGGTSITFYLNGQSNTVNEGGAILTNVASGRARIGCAAVAACWPFPGLIDDVRIYNRALTAAQIAAMYSGGK